MVKFDLVGAKGLADSARRPLPLPPRGGPIARSLRPPQMPNEEQHSVHDTDYSFDRAQLSIAVWRDSKVHQ